MSVQKSHIKTPSALCAVSAPNTSVAAFIAWFMQPAPSSFIVDQNSLKSLHEDIGGHRADFGKMRKYHCEEITSLLETILRLSETAPGAIKINLDGDHVRMLIGFEQNLMSAQNSSMITEKTTQVLTWVFQEIFSLQYFTNHGRLLQHFVNLLTGANTDIVLDGICTLRHLLLGQYHLYAKKIACVNGQFGHVVDAFNAMMRTLFGHADAGNSDLMMDACRLQQIRVRLGVFTCAAPGTIRSVDAKDELETIQILLDRLITKSEQPNYPTNELRLAMMIATDMLRFVLYHVKDVPVVCTKSGHDVIEGLSLPGFGMNLADSQLFAECIRVMMDQNHPNYQLIDSTLNFIMQLGENKSDEFWNEIRKTDDRLRDNFRKIAHEFYSESE